LVPATLLVTTLACFQQLGDALRDGLDVRGAEKGTESLLSQDVGGPSAARSRPEATPTDTSLPTSAA